MSELENRDILFKSNQMKLNNPSKFKICTPKNSLYCWMYKLNVSQFEFHPQHRHCLCPK